MVEVVRLVWQVRQTNQYYHSCSALRVISSQGLRKKLLRRGTGNSLQLLSMPFSDLRESVEEEVYMYMNCVLQFYELTHASVLKILAL